jgi:uncharacterized membrane protein YphA (DoxX/SURF4 family)
VVGASVTAPLVSVLAAVLVVAGLRKLRAPAAAADAMRAAGMPGGARAARVVGLAETAIGVLVLVAPSRPALAAMAVLYAILGWVAVRLVRSAAPVASCGCFGADDAPPSPLHAVFDAAAAGLALVAAVRPPPGLPALAARAPVAGVGLVAGCLAAAYAVSLVLSHLPQAARAYRAGRGVA